jgi:hypothetical protein
MMDSDYEEYCLSCWNLSDFDSLDARQVCNNCYFDEQSRIAARSESVRQVSKGRTIYS